MIYDFEGHTPKIDPGSWVASNAVIIGRVELKKNSNIWFNTTLRGDLEPIVIGENSNVQDGSVIHTCLLYTSPSPRDSFRSRMPSSA